MINKIPNFEDNGKYINFLNFYGFGTDLLTTEYFSSTIEFPSLSTTEYFSSTIEFPLLSTTGSPDNSTTKFPFFDILKTDPNTFDTYRKQNEAMVMELMLMESMMMGPMISEMTINKVMMMGVIVLESLTPLLEIEAQLMSNLSSLSCSDFCNHRLWGCTTDTKSSTTSTMLPNLPILSNVEAMMLLQLIKYQVISTSRTACTIISNTILEMEPLIVPDDSNEPNAAKLVLVELIDKSINKAIDSYETKIEGLRKVKRKDDTIGSRSTKLEAFKLTTNATTKRGIHFHFLTHIAHDRSEFSEILNSYYGRTTRMTLAQMKDNGRVFDTQGNGQSHFSDNAVDNIKD